MIEYKVQVDDNGTTWYLNDQLHRVDGPAVERTNGYKAWYLNGQLHRADGPAVELSNGTKSWYLNDRRHRESGPAVEYADGGNAWYQNGVEVTEEEVTKPVKQLTVVQIEALLGHKVKVIAG
jgi:hypothetical protein